MNKLIKKFTYILSLSTALFAVGCSDVDPEITSLDTDRLFSPTSVTANIVNQTGVRLNWTPNNKALYYQVLILQGSTTVKEINDVTNADIPYTVKGLEGETQYTAQIKAMANGIADSKYTTVSFKTDAEQIFYAIDPEELEPTSVILRWPAGETATHIVLTPGDIEYTVTPSDIAAGAATITGLTGETTYTAKLLKNGKIRGTRVFETPIDLGGATLISEGDDLYTILSTAEAGQKFAVSPGTYGSVEAGKVGTAIKFVIKKNVEIKALRANNKPIIKGYISLEDGASLLLKDVILDGTGVVDGSQAFIFATASQTYDSFILEGCEIRNHEVGFYYLNKASVVTTITINNCLIHDIVCNGGDLFDSRVGAIGTFTLSNSTVYNSCAARDFIRYDNASASFPSVSSVFNVTKCTLVGVSNNSSRRIFYVRFTNTALNFRNNIVTNSVGLMANQAATLVPTFSNNNYFSAAGFTTGTWGDTAGTQLDPKFADAAKGDFTVGNDDVKFAGVGDPRWLQ